MATLFIGAFMYNQKCIDEYRKGWLETHPDDDLDDETIIDCLRDQEHEIMDQVMLDFDRIFEVYPDIESMPEHIYNVAESLVNAWRVK